MTEVEIVVIAGSRDYPDLDAVARYVAALPPGTIVMTGGARGVDRAAINAARRAGLNIITCYADWTKHGKAAGPMRNRTMVQLGHRVAAFWDGRSPGTRNTIEEADKAGKPIEVYRPA